MRERERFGRRRGKVWITRATECADGEEKKQ